MTTLTIKKPLIWIEQSIFEDWFALSVSLFDLYKDKLLERYYNINNKLILEEDEDAQYYKDNTWYGLSFKKPINAETLLEQLASYHG